MRQSSLKPTFPNMPPTATAMRHPVLLTPNCLANASEEAPQPRRRQMRALVAVATTGMSSQIQLVVRPRLELYTPDLHLATFPIPDRVVCCAFCYINGRWPEETRGAFGKHSEAFLKLAARIVTFPGGDFEPSPPPQLLSKLTDKISSLRPITADAVEAVAAKQQQRPTGKAQFRLLAWTVADARGAATPLEKAAAETVGKQRLDRQAKKVRADLESCELAYRGRRLVASDVDHSSLDEAFRLEIETLRSEVYIGFHELELAVAQDAAAALPAALWPQPSRLLMRLRCTRRSRSPRSRLTLLAAWEPQASSTSGSTPSLLIGPHAVSPAL